MLTSTFLTTGKTHGFASSVLYAAKYIVIAMRIHYNTQIAEPPFILIHEYLVITMQTNNQQANLPNKIVVLGRVLSEFFLNIVL